MPDLPDLIGQLVAINSVNPSLVAGAPGEAEMAGFVAGWLEQAGLEVETVASTPGRPSVLGRVPGTGGGPALLLYAHTDTVGVEGMRDPHSPVRRGDQLFGRGALDMKSGLATVMLAAGRLARGPRLRGDVWVTAVADEEHASLGMQDVLARLAERQAHVAGCIVTEPTDLQVCVAHRGFCSAAIRTRGRAAHSSRRAEGISAIAHMGRVLVALEELDKALLQRPAHPLLEHGALVVSLISGGSELFTYPAHCEIELVRRTLPGDSAESVTAELEAILQAQAAADPQFSASLQLGLFRAALETPAEAAIVQAVCTAAGQVLGAPAPLTGATFWTDAGLIAEAGIPAVVFGPRGAGLHSDVEWVDLASVQACLDILLKSAHDFCQ
jgi:acetylornithine deacetylase